VDEEPETEPSPEAESAAMTIWRDGENGDWRPNFPPPQDYVGIEEGPFADEDYARALDVAEDAAWKLRMTFGKLLKPLP